MFSRYLFTKSQRPRPTFSDGAGGSERASSVALKMYDFMVMHRPAIVSHTRAVDDYFDDDCVVKFTDGNEHDLARALQRVNADPGRGERHGARVRCRRALRWVHQRRVYLEAVACLASRARPVADALDSERRTAQAK